VRQLDEPGDGDTRQEGGERDAPQRLQQREPASTRTRLPGTPTGRVARAGVQLPAVDS